MKYELILKHERHTHGNDRVISEHIHVPDDVTIVPGMSVKLSNDRLVHIENMSWDENADRFLCRARAV